MSEGNGAHLEFDGRVFTATPAEDRILKFDDIPDLLTMEIPSIDWIVDGLIARKSLTLWAGVDGTAKTIVATKMGIAAATGAEFLGRRCKQANVLYLDFENPDFEARRRLELLSGGLPTLPNFKVWGTWLTVQPPQLLESEVLADIAKTARPLIFIDPLRYAHSCDENDSGEMASIMQVCRSLTIHGAAIILLHHPAKQEGSTGRGSTAIRGAVDIALLQELSDETQLITLKATKNRFGDRFSVTVRPNWDTGTFEVTDSPQFTKRREEIDKIRAIIEQHPGLTQNGIYQVSGMMKSRLVAMLKEHAGVYWEEQKEGRSLLYFPIVLKTQNNPKNNRTGQGGGGCSTVLSPLGENREQSHLRPGLVVPKNRENREQVTQKPNGNMLSTCPACGSFAVYRKLDGTSRCLTCEGEAGFARS